MIERSTVRLSEIAVQAQDTARKDASAPHVEVIGLRQGAEHEHCRGIVASVHDTPVTAYKRLRRSGPIITVNPEAVNGVAAVHRSLCAGATPFTASGLTVMIGKQ